MLLVDRLVLPVLISFFLPSDLAFRLRHLRLH